MTKIRLSTLTAFCAASTLMSLTAAGAELMNQRSPETPQANQHQSTQSQFNAAPQRNKGSRDFNENHLLFPVLGVTAGTGYGPPRFGPEISLLRGRCRDSCFGIGVTAGLMNLERREYYIGGAGGGAYLGTVWMEGAAHIRNHRISGFHLNYAFGFFAMPFAEVGADVDHHTITLRAGITIKAPLAEIDIWEWE